MSTDDPQYNLDTPDPALPQDVVITPVNTDVATEAPTEVMRQVWPHDEGKVLRRAIENAVKHRVGILLLCADCHVAKKPAELQWRKLDASGDLCLVCSCTLRVLEGVWK